MTKPKDTGLPKATKPREKDDGLFPGKSDEDIIGALLKVPPYHRATKTNRKKRLQSP